MWVWMVWAIYKVSQNVKYGIHREHTNNRTASEVFRQTGKEGTFGEIVIMCFCEVWRRGNHFQCHQFVSALFKTLNDISDKTCDRYRSNNYRRQKRMGKSIDRQGVREMLWVGLLFLARHKLWTNRSHDMQSEEATQVMTILQIESKRITNIPRCTACVKQLRSMH